jgi:hypothetical protein
VLPLLLLLSVPESGFDLDFGRFFNDLLDGNCDLDRTGQLG